MSKAEERALEAYPIVMSQYSDNCKEYDSNESDRITFIEGYHQAEKDLLDNIWHSPEEEPEIDRKIIWESENFLGKHLDKEWKPKIDCFGKKERWCYLADILPSKNWTEERPYSKVDYSSGYDDGYSQAEKDLELTWGDVSLLNCLLNEVEHEFKKGMHEDKTYKGYCQEVLKRFNKEREKK